MSGEELYERYRAFLAEDSVECDEWSDLDESDKRAWDRLADSVTLL